MYVKSNRKKGKSQKKNQSHNIVFGEGGGRRESYIYLLIL